MPYSPTAIYLSEAIDQSPLTQREIAERVGFNNPNILSMLKSGDTPIPLNRIPALAQALEMDSQAFLLLAVREYNPEVHEMLVDLLGLPLSKAETEILALVRTASLGRGIVVSPGLKTALEGVFRLAMV